MDKFLFALTTPYAGRCYGGFEEISMSEDLRVWIETSSTISRAKYRFQDYIIRIDTNFASAVAITQYEKTLKDLPGDEQLKLAQAIYPSRDHVLMHGSVSFLQGEERPYRAELALSCAARHLSHLFLALNLASPGIVSYPQARLEILGHAKCYKDLRFYGELFESALHESLRSAWPPIQFLGLPKVWAWLRALDFFGRTLAASPVEKGLFSMLHLAQIGIMDPAALVWCARAFEGLFDTSPSLAFAGLFSRISKFLDIPSHNVKKAKAAFRAFYDLRGAYVHGGLPIDQPIEMGLDLEHERQEERGLDALSLPVAYLIACLQKMMVLGWKGISYREVEEGMPCLSRM